MEWTDPLLWIAIGVIIITIVFVGMLIREYLIRKE